MKPICVIGDFILDVYFFAEERYNPEGTFPCYNTTKEIISIGGAGNVQTNLESLGAKTEFFYSGERSTKIRILKNNNIVFRLDDEVNTYSKKQLKEKENLLIKEIKENAIKYDYVIVSDYNKGTITKKVAKIIMLQKWRVVVDCKPNHVEWFKGAYLWKPNKKEFLETNTDKICFDNILVTLGKEGMVLIDKNLCPKYWCYGKKVKVKNIVGAGDIVISSLVYYLNKKFDLIKSIELANLNASCFIQKNVKE